MFVFDADAEIELTEDAVSDTDALELIEDVVIGENKVEPEEEGITS